jgi:hypothetical protein
MVTNHYVTKKFVETWEKRKLQDEKAFLKVHTPMFPFRDIWDEFSAFRGEFMFLAKLVRIASAADGWSSKMSEHFGRLAMSIAARSRVLQGRCDAHTMYIERGRELSLIRAFYGTDCPEDDWPHCAVIATEYAINELLNLESEVLYGIDIDL